MSKAILTIDDISTPNTPMIMDYLIEKGIKPILFSVGKRVEMYYDEAIYALKKGAIIGNHSFSHPHFSELSIEKCIEEIQKQEEILNQLYCKAEIKREYKFFRFPYGDKGGENKDAIQEYLKLNHFGRIDDSNIDFNWYTKNKLNEDIDVLWTFDFEEYRLHSEEDFTYESIVHKIHDKNPPTGGALLDKNSHHIMIIHDHENTEEVMPGYFKTLIDYVMSCGVEFEAPRFI